MEKNQTTIQQQFKTYPKNERVADFHTSLVKLIIREPRLVHHMNLNYESASYDCDPIQSKDLHIPLEKVRIINSLLISFDEEDLQNSLILQNISMNLKSLSFLQEISLKFYYSDWVSLEGVKHLANALAQMKLLQKLILSLESCHWVNDESLHFIFRSLKKNKTLQSFELDLCNCINITEKTFKFLASIFKRSFKPLKELSLRLSGLDFPKGRPLDYLVHGLTSLKDLQKLRIDFSNLEVSAGIDFPSFMLSIKHLQSLKILSLDFSFLTISVTALKNLAKSFTSLTHLHTLSLTFQWSTRFSGPQMEILTQCLQSRAPSLKNLTLDFTDSQSVNDQALEKLSDGLRTLTNLSEIALLCDNCPEIGDAGIASVTDGLVSLPNLHTVNLEFRGCRRVKINYEENLRMNKNIIQLTFNYDICNK